MAAMPAPRHRDAPYFDGQSRHLMDFLDEFELLANQAQLDGATKCREVVRYAKSRDRNLWKTLAGYITPNWANLRAQIIALYPNAEGPNRYTMEDLRDLANAQASFKI